MAQVYRLITSLKVVLNSFAFDYELHELAISTRNMSTYHSKY